MRTLQVFCLGYLSEKLETLMSSKYHISCWKFADVSYLTMSTKLCSRFFLLLFTSLVNSKIGFSECVETRSFLVFTNNSRSKQKIPNTFLQTLVSTKHVQNYCEKYPTLRQLNLVKVFNFPDKILGLSKTIELCLNFYMGFRIT